MPLDSPKHIRCNILIPNVVIVVRINYMQEQYIYLDKIGNHKCLIVLNVSIMSSLDLQIQGNLFKFMNNLIE